MKTKIDMYRQKFLKGLLTSILLVLTYTTLFSDNWQTGTGGKPSRHGLSAEIGPQAADLLWQGSLTSVIAQQAVIDGNIVFMSRMLNINDVLGGTKIVAQNLLTGDTLWTKGLPVDFPSTDWRSRVSAVRNGIVYATRSGNTNYSYMYALNATDGSIIWKSQGLVNESSTEGSSFASNGDLIVGNFESIIRINAIDGITVWETTRSCPTSNGQEVAVFEGKGYYWEAAFAGPKISVIDLESGAYLYSSESLSPGLIQQTAPFVGPDGTVYGTRSMNNVSTDFLFALSDKGSYLEEKWIVPLGYVPFATFGVGPDGSVYSYSQSDEVIRIDPLNGSIIDTSEVSLGGDFSQPRMAIDAQGFVFVTNGGFNGGAFYSFNPDLTLRWSENIPNVNVGGPAIGNDGTLIVCGTGTNVRAYQGIGTGSKENPQPILLKIYPNPSKRYINIECDLEKESSSEITIEILNSNSIQLYSKEYQSIGDELLRETIQIKNWEEGVYFIRLKNSRNIITVKSFVVM